MVRNGIRRRSPGPCSAVRVRLSIPNGNARGQRFEFRHALRNTYSGAPDRIGSGSGNTSYVVHPADPAAYGRQAGSGTRYVEFDVPPDSLAPAGKEGWAQIPGPNSLYGRLAVMRGMPAPQFPPALNIEWLLTK
jgi:hypothetical protein